MSEVGGALALGREVAGPRRRVVGGRGLSAVLPGAPQLLAGRWGVGAAALLTWAGFWWVLFARWPRVRVAVGGAWDEQLAVATLAAGLVGAWVWSWRDAGRPFVDRAVAVSQWDLAVRAFSRNRTAVAGLIIIGALYAVALLTPLLAPYDPLFQGNLVTERFVGPSPAHPLGRTILLATCSRGCSTARGSRCRSVSWRSPSA
jgi:hypothetical protein